MLIDIVVAGLAVVAVGLVQFNHHKRHDEEVKALTTFVMQNQRAIDNQSLRKLYLKALHKNTHHDLHYWLNETQGNIQVGHVWLVRQYVLNQKPLPYPVPIFS